MPYESYLGTTSPPRSKVYERVFRTTTPEETTGALMWAQAISTVLMSFTGMFEVALRNRMHVSLSRQATAKLGVDSSDSYPWYDKSKGWKTLTGETHEKVERLLSENGIRTPVQPSPDRVVAGLSMGVWPNILAVQLTQQEQRKTFIDVFASHPKHKKKFWDYDPNRDDVAKRCRKVQDLRNRLAHCNPVWPEGWFSNSASQHWTDMLRRVVAQHSDALELLEWMCPSTAQVYRSSFAGQWFNQLCTEDAVLHYVQQPLGVVNLGIPAADRATLTAFIARQNMAAPAPVAAAARPAPAAVAPPA